MFCYLFLGSTHKMSWTIRQFYLFYVLFTYVLRTASFVVESFLNIDFYMSSLQEPCFKRTSGSVAQRAYVSELAERLTSFERILSLQANLELTPMAFRVVFLRRRLKYDRTFMFTWVDEAPTRRRRLNDSEKRSSRLSSFGLEYESSNNQA